ncbi:MAG: hypothetical protein WCO10_01020 [bacterium]
MKKISQRGFIKMIIIVIIAIIILSWYGLDLKKVVESEGVQTNLNYVWNGIVYFWNHYLAAPAAYLWDIFITYAWTPFLKLISASK